MFDFISIFVTATVVGEATLRAWERRFGFPEPRREPSGHRRYSAADVERIRAVVRERARGLALAVAIDRVTAESSGPPSLFAPLRERRPDLLPVSIRKPQLIHLSRAVEEESAARAERALIIGAFQRPGFYRASEARWQRLARGAEMAFVLMGADCTHHDRRVLWRRTMSLQDSMGEQSPGASVIEAADDVPDIMEVGRNSRELLLATVEAHSLQDVAGDVSDEPDVAKPVLGVSDHSQIAVGMADESLDLGVAFYRIEGD